MEQSPPPQYAQYPRPGSGPGVGGGEFPHRGPGVYFEHIGEAFKLIFRNPKVYLGSGGIILGMLAIWYVVYLVGFFMVMPKESRSQDPSGFLAYMGVTYLGLLLMMWFLGVASSGITACAIEDANGGHSTFATLKTVFRRFWAISLVTLITGLLSTVGFMLCFFPGLYVAGLLSLAPAICLKEGLGPIESIQKSYEVIRPHGLMMAVLFLVVIIIMYAGSMCGIGTLFTWPLYYVMGGLLYRDFCIPVQRQTMGPGPNGPGPTVGPGGFQMPG
jgi:uncharacterized membrane protein